MTSKGNWLAAAGVAVGVVFAAVVGIFSYIRATTPTLHPDPKAVSSVADPAPSEKWIGAAEQARLLVRSAVATENLPGMSVAVGVGGQIVWAEGFGFADVERRAPVTPNSRFRIGHASKPLTSAAVGLLLEKDRLRLGEEIQTYVPSFPRKQWPITLRQVMANVSGIRHYKDSKEYSSTNHCERAADGLPVFAQDPLRFEPDNFYGYSSYGWVLVSAAVEAVAGEPFFAFMRSRVFEPAGMRQTSVDSAPEAAPDRVTFYHPRFSGDAESGPALAPAADYSCLAGAGAFLSTPSDLVRFALALRSGKLLQPDTVKTLQRPQVLLSGNGTDYGLGWMLYGQPGDPSRAAGHVSVTLYGGSASFLMYPERDVVVALMTNISSTHTRDLAEKVAGAFFATEPTPAK